MITMCSKKMIEASLIVTSFNEESRIREWCSSFMSMTTLPSEIVVIDSMSTDMTIKILQENLVQQGYTGDLTIKVEKCNISEGRNRGIEIAANESCLITDFGVEFDVHWCEKLYQSLKNNDWVGGVYRMISSNKIQESFCNLFDNPIESLDDSSFLPSSRSFGIKRSVFLDIGGYDTSLVIGEDTDLIYRLKARKLNYAIAKDAVVSWWPRENIKAIYIQNYRYAYWDGIAKNNFGRLLHIAFFLVPIVIFLTLSVFFSSGLLLLLLFPYLYISSYLKANINTIRNRNSKANVLDVLVYFVTLMSSSIGFVVGLLKGVRG